MFFEKYTEKLWELFIYNSFKHKELPFSRFWILMKKVLIIGAGPAGLTAAYELAEKSKDFEIIVFEESGDFGGISKTVNYKGNRMDMGGHRFFSKVPEVNAWWEKMLPTQGALPHDDVVLGRQSTVAVTSRSA